MDKLKDLRDLTEKVVERKPQNVDEILEVSKELAYQISAIEDKMNQIQKARGAVMESATHIEKVFDEILIRTNKPEMVHSSRFRKKAKFLRGLMEVFDPEKKVLNEGFLINLEKVVILRNLFAHVPINYFQTDLEFDSSDVYLHFFDGDLKLKNVKYSANLFIDGAKDILQKVPEFIKIVLDVVEKQKTFIEEVNQILKELPSEEEDLKNDKSV